MEIAVMSNIQYRFEQKINKYNLKKKRTKMVQQVWVFAVKAW